MEITSEKIQLVMDKTGVTDKEAKDYLAKFNGNVVDVIICLEENDMLSKGHNLGKRKKKNARKMGSNELMKKWKELGNILRYIRREPSIPSEEKVELIKYSIFTMAGALGSMTAIATGGGMFVVVPAISGFLIPMLKRSMIRNINKVSEKPRDLVVLSDEFEDMISSNIIDSTKKDSLNLEKSDDISDAKAGVYARYNWDELILRVNELDKYQSEWEDERKKNKEIFANLGIKDLSQNSDEILRQVDLGDLYKKQRASLEDRLRRVYKNIVVSDLVMASLLFLPFEKEQEIEKEICKLNLNSTELKTSAACDAFDAYEIKTAYGMFFISFKMNKIYIDFIEFTDNIMKLIPIKDITQANYSIGQNKILYRGKIRKLFINTLKLAKKEICIVSPWLDKEVIEDIIPFFEMAFKNKVSINILYGFSDGGSNKKNAGKDSSSDQVAEYLMAEFKNISLFSIRKANTHVKLLICDDIYCVLGSYNFLSFRGEFKEDTRDEIAFYIRNIDKVAELKDKYFPYRDSKLS